MKEHTALERRGLNAPDLPQERAGSLRLAGRGLLVPGWLLSVAAALMVLGGFFLPWMDGEGAFGARAFSGLDFARLVRNFEIVASSSSSSAQIRGTAVAIYLVPAVAANSAFLYVLAPLVKLDRRALGRVLLIGAGYIVAILVTLAFLSIVPVTEFQTAVGIPLWGFGLTLAGGLLFAGLGYRELKEEG